MGLLTSHTLGAHISHVGGRMFHPICAHHPRQRITTSRTVTSGSVEPEEIKSRVLLAQL